MKKVAVLMGSETDRPIMEAALPYLEKFSIPYEVSIMSAHRNPADVEKFATAARDQGFGVIIAGAGMAAHLAGAVKAHSSLPVIGVPLPGGLSDGLDALLSTVQMPKGVPVATMSVGKAGAINAAVLAAEILSLEEPELVTKLGAFKAAGAIL
ncbi:MAG: 5-(carboxyamino)imidazole ribonucleotide mutase [Candidatus Marinimicrobia bacterium]|nr:5-(carboxyamino)imidazole ribonucleotide mutase [Candidatus Neomarinimicrobiota bacterium]